MTREKLSNFYFSQSSLECFHQCRLKFRKRYLDGLYWSKKELLKVEQVQAMERGVLFHLLAQRYFSGLPTGIESNEEPELQLWLDRLIKLFPLDSENSFLPEYQLRINRQGEKLVAKYDLICLKPGNQITIYDWKTDKHPLLKERLMSSWQTILYRYLLLAGGVGLMGESLKASQIKMVYWNPLYSDRMIELPYSQDLYEQDRRLIQETIAEISSLKEADFLPTTHLKTCSSCEYSHFCRRNLDNSDYLLGEPDLEEEFSWEEIADYPY